jgi:hypothetical protein
MLPLDTKIIFRVNTFAYLETSKNVFEIKSLLVALAVVERITSGPNPATFKFTNTAPEGSFLNGFLRLWEKLAPTPALDLARVGAYGSFKKLPSALK